MASFCWVRLSGFWSFATRAPVTRKGRGGRGAGIIASQMGRLALELSPAYVQIIILESTINLKKIIFNISVKWFHRILSSTYAHDAENSKQRTHAISFPNFIWFTSQKK